MYFNLSVPSVRLCLEQMECIPLSFSRMTFPKGKEYGRILGEQPWIHVDVLTKMVVFIPLVGAKVRGKVTKVCVRSKNDIAFFDKANKYNLTGFEQ